MTRRVGRPRAQTEQARLITKLRAAGVPGLTRRSAVTAARLYPGQEHHRFPPGWVWTLVGADGVRLPVGSVTNRRALASVALTVTAVPYRGGTVWEVSGGG